MSEHDPLKACERYADAIDQYVDGTLEASARQGLAAHLEACPDCRCLAADLERIRETARSLERLPVPEDIWPSIVNRLGAGARLAAESGPPEARLAGTSWRWMGIAALALLVVGSTLLTLRWTRQNAGEQARAAQDRPVEPPAAPHTDEGRPAAGQADAGTGELVESIEAELRSAEQHYLKAIEGLEQIAKAQEGALDPQLARTVEQNIAVIDRAIDESRSALLAQPESRPAQQSLFEALRRKVSLLQDTIALVNEMRKGNETEAARIVEGLNKS